MRELSNHARRRCAQRNIDGDVVELVRQHGRKVHRTGVVFYFLGRRDIPADLQREDGFAKLEGTVLLVSPEGELITAYRNRSALRKIQKKAKHRVACWN